MTARRQQGAIVLELALTLGFLFPVAAMLIFYGRVLYNYEVAQKAAHDAVRYMASASIVNINNPALVTYEVAVAQAILQQELSVLNPDKMAMSVACDGQTCAGMAVPEKVTVGVQINVRNDLVGLLPALPDQRIAVTQSMRYVGN
jgi:Flp pilus assembly protein TadG